MSDDREMYSARAVLAATARVSRMGPDERAAMTRPASEARAQRYLERVMREIDPDGTLPVEERERQARYRITAQQAKTKLERLKRERRMRELLGNFTALEEVQAS